MKLRVGFTTDIADPICLLVRRLTQGRFSHCFPMFEVEVGEDSDAWRYFESHWKRDPVTGKSGVRGPLPVTRITDWCAENPTLHLFEHTEPLPLTAFEVRAAWDICLVAVPVIHYAKLQIAQNWLEARTGISIERRGDRKWTCSEHVCRCMPPRLWGYFDLLNVSANRIAPCGTRMVSVETAVARMQRAVGPVPA